MDDLARLSFKMETLLPLVCAYCCDMYDFFRLTELESQSQNLRLEVLIHSLIIIIIIMSYKIIELLQ